MKPEQPSLFSHSRAGVTSVRKRDDPIARCMRLNQGLKPTYFLDFPEDNISVIRAVNDPNIECGWVDLQALRAGICLNEIFDEPLAEQEAYELMDEGPGESHTPDEWVEHGWSEPEIELWFEDDCLAVWGGELCSSTAGSSVADLSAKLHWALDPRGTRGGSLEIRLR